MRLSDQDHMMRLIKSKRYMRKRDGVTGESQWEDTFEATFRGEDGHVYTQIAAAHMMDEKQRKNALIALQASAIKNMRRAEGG